MLRARFFSARFWGARYLSAHGTPPAPPTNLPLDIIIAWPGTAASIPAGWERVTALDDRHIKIAAAALEPGATGGTASHSHTTPAHVHTTDHTHTLPDSSGATGGSTRDSGTTNPPLTHTHTSNPSTLNPTTTLTAQAATMANVNNDPPSFSVIFLRSLGTTTGFPALALAFWADSAALPTGWQLGDGASGRPDVRNRFLKGTSGDGGSTLGTDSHAHLLNTHTHSATYSHSHPDGTSSATATAMTSGAGSGATAAVATGTHTHALALSTTAPAVSDQTEATSATGGSLLPPFTVLACLQNTSGAVSWPDGMLALWMESLGSIPDDWHLCDGTEGTPDLRDRFLRCASTLADIGITGGSTTHGHTAAPHSHPVASHTHTVTGGTGASELRNVGTVTNNASTNTHTHTWPATSAVGFTSGSTTPTVDDATAIEPPFTTVVILQWQAPVPLGLTVQVGQVTDTETAEAVSWRPQARHVALTTETGTSQAVAISPLVRLLSATQDTETVQSVAWAPQTRLLGGVQAAETPQPLLVSPLSRLVAPVSETTTSQSVAWSPRTRLLLAVTSSEMAGIVSTVAATVLGSPTETATAQALAAGHLIGLGHPLETTTSQSLTRLQIRLHTAVTETTDTLPLVVRKTIPLAASLSTEMVQAVLWAPRTRLLLPVLSTATAQEVLIRPLTRLLAAVLATDTAQSMTAPGAALLTPVLATDTAAAILWAPKLRQLTAVLETTTGAPVRWAPQARLVLAVLATELSQAVFWRPRARLVALVSETTLAQVLTAPDTTLLYGTMETTTSQALGRSPFARLLLAVTDTATSQPLFVAPRFRLLLQAVETALSQALTAPGAKLLTAVLETTTAAAMARSPQARLLGIPQDLATVLIVSKPGGALLLLVEESATSQVLTWRPQARLLSPCTETTTAQGFVWRPQARLLSQVSTTETAAALLWVPQRLIVQLTESTTAVPVTASHVAPLALLVETALAQPLLPPHKMYSLVTIPEVVTVADIMGLRLVALSLLTESASAEAVGTTKRIILESLQEQAEASVLLWRPQARFVASITEADLVSLLTTISGIIRYAISGTWSLTPALLGTWTARPVVEAEEWESTPIVTGVLDVNAYE